MSALYSSSKPDLKIVFMTKIAFTLSHPINSKEVKKGDRVSFETAHDVTVNTPQGDALIPRGTVATGVVEKSKKAWWFFGKQGHLQISMPSQIQDVKGNIFSLASAINRMQAKGGGDRRYWSPILSFVVFPLPFWIWKGKNAKIIDGFQAQIHTASKAIKQESTEMSPAYQPGNWFKPINPQSTELLPAYQAENWLKAIKEERAKKPPVYYVAMAASAPGPTTR
jgi:hypothetical protein